jgi:hypothetical protein
LVPGQSFQDDPCRFQEENQRMVDFQYIAAVSLMLSFVSISLVLVQLYDNITQRRIDANIRISDINRDLVSLGFAHPTLFAVLHGEASDPIVERRYLQLWFNQFLLIYTYQARGLFRSEHRESLGRDIGDFLKLQNVQSHWREFRQYYPSSFQGFVNSLLPDYQKSDA